MVNSKVKGKRMEQLFARKLTELTGHKWHRTANSGAMATAQGIKDNRFKGDLFCEDFPDIVIEVKATKDRITLEDLHNENSLFWKWVEQCERESGNKPWVLLFHSNNGYYWGAYRDLPPISREIQQLDIFDKEAWIKVSKSINKIIVYKLREGDEQ